jgi:DNA-binding MarR family transcriptional regulator
MTVEYAIKLLSGISAVDPEMPLGQAKCLFIIAQAEDGMSLTDIAKKAGIGLATASRNIAALGKINRKREEGLHLIESFEDPMERRKKIIRLTAKGKTTIKRILGD